MKIHINKFVTRQTPESKFSSINPNCLAPFQDPWMLLRFLVYENWNERKPGYRDGVVLVPLPGVFFLSPVTTLVAGMNLSATYQPRR